MPHSSVFPIIATYSLWGAIDRETENDFPVVVQGIQTVEEQVLDKGRTIPVKGGHVSGQSFDMPLIKFLTGEE